MTRDKLLEQTKFLEEELGACLLVVKCFELLGQRDDARLMAQQITWAELERLTQMSERAFGIGPMSEQFLRVIYAFEVAVMPHQVVQVFLAFIEKAKNSRTQLSLQDGIVAFRLGMACVLANEPTIDFENVLKPTSFGAAITQAWRSGSREEIEGCMRDLEIIIEIAETDDQIAPWEDVWHYILLSRLQSRLGK